MAHIDTSEVIRASIWIRPTGDALTKVEDAIRIANKRGGGPRVDPHITVLSGIERTHASAEEKLKQLAMRIRPFTVKLSRIELRHDYFKSLYATVDDGTELEAVHRDAHDVFEMNPPDPFTAHMSLLYADADEALKQEIAREIGSLDVSFEVNAVHLVNASASLPVTKWRDLARHDVGRK